MRMVCPGCNFATSTNDCHAVKAPIGTAAASTKFKDFGFAATSHSLTVTYCAQAPPKVGYPYTASPTFSFVTFAPVFSTTPAMRSEEHTSELQSRFGISYAV